MYVSSGHKGWVSVACVCMALVYTASATGDDRFAGLDDYVNEAIKLWEIPGLAISVVQNGETVLTRSYGICERGTDRKVEPNTRFPIASCAKSIVSASIGVLVEENKLSWDDPVIRHIAEFELADPYLTKNLTLRDLLTQRTGLQRCDLLTDHTTSSETIARLRHIPVVAAMRTKPTYSNPMYKVLREVVSRVSGQSWEQFVRDRFFRPLQMKSTVFSLTNPQDPQVALRHWRSDGGVIPRRRPDRGISSTIGDMTQWLRLHLSEGVYDRDRILRSRTVREMHALQFSVPIRSRPPENVYAAQFYGYGLGWVVQDYRGHKVVLHGGAWGAMVALIPEENLGVVVLSNSDLESLPALLMFDVFDAYLHPRESPWRTEKWKKLWLKNSPPGVAWRPRDKARRELEKTRRKGTIPQFPLKNYAGRYRSELYGDLTVEFTDDRLSATFDGHTTTMQHWHDEAFYVRSPTKLTFDWLLEFVHEPDSAGDSITVRHVGWDTTEKDHSFRKVK